MGQINLHSVWIWLALIVFASGFPVFLGLLIGGISRITPLFRGDHRAWRIFWGTTIAVEWGVTAVVAASLLFSGNSLSAVGLISPGESAVWICVAALALLVVLTLRSSPVPGVVSTADPKATILPHTRGERLAWLLAVCPTAAFCEELTYRGFFLVLLRAAIGLPAGLVLQALVFAFHHGGHRQGAGLFLFRAAIGLGFGLLVIWRGNLLAAMAIHFCVDAAFALAPPRAAAVKA